MEEFSLLHKPDHQNEKQNKDTGGEGGGKRKQKSKENPHYQPGPLAGEKELCSFALKHVVCSKQLCVHANM